ncbi:uncharacterized protein LOC100901178 [Galendromus occidentalis]|uniref:Protein ARV n=1 Tax=Galendromus occidentalis TaxID=34638 RepID=A0AAJ6QXL9_9ACAR|nr:uncharacterized protein LOC100901178 [Galendromus occidentalis]
MAAFKLCCIHCGADTDELHHVFCGTLRLRECGKCGKFVDELLEVEPMIIGVKLFLQRKEVYRHFCRNALGDLPLQVPIILLAIEMFLAWTIYNQAGDFDSTVDGFKWNVVRIITQVLLGWIAHVLTVCVALRLFSNDFFKMSRIFFIIVVASFCKLFNLGVLLWSPPECHEYAAYVVEGCWLLAQYRMLQCSLEGRPLCSALIVSCAAYSKFAASSCDSISVFAADSLSQYF